MKAMSKILKENRILFATVMFFIRTISIDLR